jgi:curved DNA-binding protein CbpA
MRCIQFQRPVDAIAWGLVQVRDGSCRERSGEEHVSRGPFVDYYELLQVSANADEDTIHRVFRHLAKRYHPDAPGQRDAEHFNLLVEAHRTLTNAEARAAYDAKYERYWNSTWKVVAEAADDRGFIDDADVRGRLLVLFYVQRRRSMRQPGMGDMQLARLVGTPPEHLEFHLWYLKEKGWIERTETGLYAVTAEGVDQVEQRRLDVERQRLIETRAPGEEGEAADRSPSSSSSGDVTTPSQPSDREARR